MSVVDPLEVIDVDEEQTRILVQATTFLEQGVPPGEEGLPAHQAGQLIHLADSLELAEYQEHLAIAFLKGGDFTVEV